MNLLLALSLVSATEIKTFSGGTVRLEITTPSGDVKIVGSDRQDVEVTIDKHQFDPKDCEIMFEHTNGVLVIEVKKSSGWFKSECDVSFTIAAPQAIDVRTTSGSGDLRVRGIKGAVGFVTGSGDVTIDGEIGELDGKTGSGEIVARGLMSSARLKLGSGDVRLEYSKVPSEGEIEIRSGSGDAIVTLPESAKFKVRFRAGSGDMHTEIADTPGAKFVIDAKSGSGDLRIARAR